MMAKWKSKVMVSQIIGLVTGPEMHRIQVKGTPDSLPPFSTTVRAHQTQF